VSKRRGPTPKRKWQEMHRAVGPTGTTERGQFWRNDWYTVIANEMPGGMLWLSIRRNDRKVMRDWRDFQRIKNDIAGPEREGFEMFPAESRLVDTVNQYHLWVLPEGQRLPVGWNARLVTDEDGQFVLDGRVIDPDELKAAVESYGVGVEMLTKTRQRPGAAS
jgi:hypothetical protein